MSEARTVQEFVTSFNREAPDFPLMFRGTLDKAISACWPKNTKNESAGIKKILALYIQKGFGEEFVEFVRCLSSRRMKMILMESFVIWGWDVEDPGRIERQNDYVALITDKLGKAVSPIVSDLNNNPFPKLYLLVKARDSLTLVRKISDNPTEDQMFLEIEATASPLLRASTGLLEPMNLREKRKSSLANKETLGDRIEKRASSIAEQQRQRRQLSGRMSVLGVPPEPEPSERGVVVVRFVHQDSAHERRFSEDDKVDAVINYLISIGYTPESYRFMGRKSRTDLGKVDRALRLKALQVGKEEIITIKSIKNGSVDIL